MWVTLFCKWCELSSEILLHHSRHKKRFLTQGISNTTICKTCLHWCKYGLSYRCSQIHLLCSFWMTSRAESDPRTSQVARKKSFQAWMCSNTTLQKSPGCFSFSISIVKHIILVEWGSHLVNHNAWIVISLDVSLSESLLHCVVSILSVSTSFPALYCGGRPAATDLPLYML